MSPLLFGVWGTAPMGPALGGESLVSLVPLRMYGVQGPVLLQLSTPLTIAEAVYTVTSPALLIPHAAVSVAPFTVIGVYFLLAKRYPWALPALSVYNPTTSPVSLIPMASVPVEFGTLR